ncbi:hypothetical protein RJ639_002327 [Escallonia herrerae]|uniref:Uncharacterized protein n=1 Tax=Escallonia herrerae TaxID=1293975 RepID=A0AA88X7A2_9ASTE|nr:hypothetical protein RJ639_002327 [Escallonia herrerae]
MSCTVFHLILKLLKPALPLHVLSISGITSGFKIHFQRVKAKGELFQDAWSIRESGNRGDSNFETKVRKQRSASPTFWSHYFKWTGADGDDVDLSNKQEFTAIMKNPQKARMITATERIGQMGSNMLVLIFRIRAKWVLKSQELGFEEYAVNNFFEDENVISNAKTAENGEECEENGGDSQISGIEKVQKRRIKNKQANIEDNVVDELHDGDANVLNTKTQEKK